MPSLVMREWFRADSLIAKSGRDLLIVFIATLLLLGLFLNKAFHIDDPLFIWAAKQIEKTPSNFYGFDVNWYGTTAPAFSVIKNPPLASYYIAVVSRLFGWTERGLHLAFLFPAVACTIGTYLLSSRFCSRPLLASLCLLLMPAFLVSSTTIMCDTLMLAFWIWAIVLWDKGLKTNSLALMLAATFLVGLASLTKYFAISLLPLLLAFAAVKKSGRDWRLLTLLVPVAMLVGYEMHTRALYGRGLLADATVYVTHFRNRDFFQFAVTGLAFTGGCVLAPLCFFQRHWSPLKFLAPFIAAVLLWLVLTQRPPANLLGQVRAEHVSLVALQIVLLSILGAAILFLPILQWHRVRDAESMLLILWVAGTFVFATVLNWTVNARSFLPACPAVAIAVVRRLDQQLGSSRSAWEPRLVAFLTPALAISLLVAYGDYQLANHARAAASICKSRQSSELSTVWFEGHWGFQYYMQLLGTKPVDVSNSVVENGDLLVVPSTAANIFSIPPQVLRLSFVVEPGASPLVATMDRSLGAGFYASEWGPLPFAFGPAEPQRYQIFSVVHELRFLPPQ